MTDARRQSPVAQQKSRLEVVRLADEGVGVMEIVRRTGLSWGAVRRTLDRYRTAGVDGLEPDARGRKPGTGAKLTDDQEAEIRQLMRRRPRQQGMQGWLWTRSAVIELVKRTYGVTLSERGIGNYLAAWGIALANPRGRPEARCSPVVRDWLAQHYATLYQEAKSRGEEIIWLYRAKRLDATLWGPSHVTEVASPAGGMPLRLSVAMAASNQGKLFWMIVAGRFDTEKQAKLINGLQRDTGGRPIIAIRDEASTYATSALHANINARLVPTSTDLASSTKM